MEINNHTFCAAAWFQLRNQQNGEYQPCCQINLGLSQFQGKVIHSWPETAPIDYLNSDYLRYLRQQLQLGNRVPECDRCWHKEDHGLRSLRQIMNDLVTVNRSDTINTTWTQSYMRQKTNFDHDLLLSVDVKLSNVCNFACMMCNPDDSTQIYSIWSKNQDHAIVQEKLRLHPGYLIDISRRYRSNQNYELLTNLLDKTPLHVKILGGEPLLDYAMLEVLQAVPEHKKSHISLLFVTNGSVDLVEFSKQLSDYKEINFVISIDGVNRVQDYVRRGSRWPLIENNIQRWNRQHRPVDLHCTIQCLNLLHVPGLLDWSNQQGCKITFGFVRDPEYLSLAVIPPALRSQIRTVLDPCCPGLVDTLQDHEYRPELLPKFQSFLDWYDPDQEWQSIFPEWQALLSKAPCV